MRQLIAISLSPNTERKDVLYALKNIVFFWTYFKKDNVFALENWFRQYFKVSNSTSFATGRTALFAILKSLEIKDGDEVAMQAFTCVAVADAVLETKAKPLYIDVTKSLTMDSIDLSTKISKKTKAIIVQHTFGIPSDMGKILDIAKEHAIPVIEDVAHSIGGEYQAKKLGTFGNAAIFSFGRDKAFSSVFGGMAITDDKELGKKIRDVQKKLKRPHFFWTLQQLFHPVAFAFILPLYNVFSIGKLLLVFLQKLHLLSFPVLPIEKRGVIAPVFMKKMPNNLAGLALFQLKRIKRFNSTRESFVSMYCDVLKKSSVVLPYKEKAPLLRFPILTKKRDELIARFRAEGIYLGNWYAHCIDPKDTDFSKIFYTPSSCPKAQQYAKEIINLPTNPTLPLKRAKLILKLLEKYA